MKLYIFWITECGTKEIYVINFYKLSKTVP